MKGGTSVNAETVRRWMTQAAASVREQRDYLTQLDAAIGDADHGANMDRGFSAVVAKLEATDDAPPPGRLLITAGSTLVSTVGGASGPLWGTALRRAGRSLGDSPEFDGPELADALDAALAGVVELGAAQEGEKTMVDALAPAVRALRQELGGGARARRTRPRGGGARTPRGSRPRRRPDRRGRDSRVEPVDGRGPRARRRGASARGRSTGGDRRARRDVAARVPSRGARRPAARVARGRRAAARPPRRAPAREPDVARAADGAVDRARAGARSGGRRRARARRRPRSRDRARRGRSHLARRDHGARARAAAGGRARRRASRRNGRRRRRAR